MTITAGEVSPDIGREGLHSARRWLGMSTRVSEIWTHQDAPLNELLAFSWPHSAGTFTFDLGGRFRGDELDGHSFVAEVKKYKNEGDLPTLYRDFLAKCYVAYDAHPDRCRHFLWLSWSPFQAKRWDHHTTIEAVSKAVLHSVNRQRVLGTSDETEARLALDAATLTAVSERLWLLTLSMKQESFVLTKEHYLEVVRLITAEAV
jgi:hypothetical protein